MSFLVLLKKLCINLIQNNQPCITPKFLHLEFDWSKSVELCCDYVLVLYISDFDFLPVLFCFRERKV